MESRMIPRDYRRGRLWYGWIEKERYASAATAFCITITVRQRRETPNDERLRPRHLTSSAGSLRHGDLGSGTKL